MFNFIFMLYKFRYADLLDDEVFKLVFGRESTKDVMIEFFKVVLVKVWRDFFTRTPCLGIILMLLASSSETFILKFH